MAPGSLAATLIREHGQIWRLMDEVSAAVSNPAVPAAEVTSWCRSLLELLEQHNAKEEPIIYPHTDADLDADSRKRLDAFLIGGQMPAGWTCQRASA